MPRIRDDSELAPARAKAQRQREAEFMAHLGRANHPDGKSLVREIKAQLQIIKSDQAALKQVTLGAFDRKRLEEQVEARSEGVKVLRRPGQ